MKHDDLNSNYIAKTSVSLYDTNCEILFSLKTASNAKTDKIFAYCVLQVGIYRRQADQKWSQKWIWWVFHFLHLLTFCDQLSLHTFSIYLPSSDQSEHISRCAWHICRWKNLNISKRIQKFWDLITFPGHFRLCVRFRRPVQLAHIRPRITL